MFANNDKNLYFGNCALEKANMYLQENLPLQKFLVLLEKDNFNTIKSTLNNEFAIYICLSDYTSSEIEIIKKNLKEEVRLVLVVGGEQIINAAKYLSSLLKCDFCVVETVFSSSLTLLDKCQIIKNGYICEEPSKRFTFYYIDSGEILKTEREQMTEMYAFICSKVGYILDVILSAKIFKTDFKCSVQQDMKLLLNNLQKISNSLIYKENILVLKDIVIELAKLLKITEYSVLTDKQFVASNLFCYLTKSYKQFNQISLNYCKVFTLLYGTFLSNLQALKCSVFDIEKRVNLFDKFFSKSGFEFDYNSLNNYEQTFYVITFMQEQILTQCVSTHKLISLFNTQCLSYLEDGGFVLKKRLKDDKFMQALCFTPDVLVGKNMVKVVKNFGLLDLDV